MLSTTMLLSGQSSAQKINFQEYDLNNGLHVILHQDKATPVVIASVMYHVGAKDEHPEKTGFAHFFEHLLFEGTQNIQRGEWFKIVSSHGGVNNANTSEDRTYYYEVFPSNNLELALWMESERMLHPVINQIGVDTQNEVVKEEKRSRQDNQPYGSVITAIKQNLYQKHPYRWATIGSMAHLDTATLADFQDFYNRFYIPNNAVLVVAGDFEFKNAKKWIDQYFSEIPKGVKIPKSKFEEQPIVETIKATYTDENIQIPMAVAAYRTPSMKTRESRVLDFISAYLSDGKSSKLYRKMVDEKKMALQIGAFCYSQEDYGMYILYGLPMTGYQIPDLIAEMDAEIANLQTELISEKDFQKLQNQFENQYINKNASIERVAENLAKYYLLYQDIDLINEELKIYQSITREEIQTVAQQYLKTNQRVLLDYIPSQTTN